MSRALQLAAVIGLALAACKGGERVDPAPAASASAKPPPAPAFTRLTLDPAERASLEKLFFHHEVLPDAVYQGRVGPESEAIIALLRMSASSKATVPPALAVVRPGATQAQQVKLTRRDESDLVAVEAFDLRDLDGDYRPEILFIARLADGKGPSAPSHRRAYHLGWREDGSPVASLPSWILRADTSIATLDDLAAKVSDLLQRKVCPALDARMDEDTLVASLRCLIDGDHRAEIAALVSYPMQVLLKSGEVRVLRSAAEMLAVYDDVIDDEVKATVRRWTAEPSYWQSYWGLRLGRGGPAFDQGKILGIWSLDAGAHARLRERLAREERDLWRPRRSDTLCRTRRATHVFSMDSTGRRFQLASWDDPRAVVGQRAPDRLLFGMLASHGTCGNNDYVFVGPGPDVEFHEVVCYGPEPTPEKYLDGEGGVEPCLNHRMLR